LSVNTWIRNDLFLAYGLYSDIHWFDYEDTLDTSIIWMSTIDFTMLIQKASM